MRTEVLSAYIKPLYDKVTFYLDELLEGDRELFLSEQSNIKHTWEIVAQLIKYDIDPTDSFR